MPNQEHERHGGDPRPAGTGGKIEVRPRNWLVPVILLTLRESASYGYELMERTAGFGFEAMNPGTLYRTLRNMERDGLCESEWETSKGGPARRVYSITDAGEAYLASGPRLWSSTGATWTPFSASTREASHQHAKTGRKTTGRRGSPDLHEGTPSIRQGVRIQNLSNGLRRFAPARSPLQEPYDFKA